MPSEFSQNQQSNGATSLVAKFLTSHSDKGQLLKKLVTVLQISQTLAIYVILETQCTSLDQAYTYLFEEDPKDGLLNHLFVGTRDVRGQSMMTKVQKP